MEDEAPDELDHVLPAIKIVFEIKQELDEIPPQISPMENDDQPNVSFDLTKFSNDDESRPPTLDLSTETPDKRRLKNFYSLAEKLKAVELAEQTSNSYAARQFNVDRKSIKDWRKSKDKLLLACTVYEDGNRKRQRGGGKKILSGELEQCLLVWIKQELKKPNPQISWRILKRKAVEIFDVLKSRGLVNADVFKGSNGWLEKFLKRHDFDKTITDGFRYLSPADAAPLSTENNDVSTSIDNPSPAHPDAGPSCSTTVEEGYSTEPGNFDYTQFMMTYQFPEPSSNDDNATTEKQTKRFYSLAEKLQAVQFAELTSTNKAAREYNVDRKRIQEWRLAKEKITRACNNFNDGQRKRQRGGGKKPISYELELRLLNWINIETRDGQRNVSWRILQNKAREIFNDLKNEGVITTQVFKASNGWLQNFLKRHTYAFPASESIEVFDGADEFGPEDSLTD